PHKRAPIGRKARTAEEVVPSCQYPTRISTRMAQIDSHDGIGSLTAPRVILAHSDPAPAMTIDHAVRKAVSTSGGVRLACELLGLRGAQSSTIQTAVSEIREVRPAVAHRPCAAAVFMHARSHVH